MGRFVPPLDPPVNHVPRLFHADSKGIGMPPHDGEEINITFFFSGADVSPLSVWHPHAIRK